MDTAYYEELAGRLYSGPQRPDRHGDLLHDLGATGICGTVQAQKPASLRPAPLPDGGTLALGKTSSRRPAASAKRPAAAV